MNIDTNETKESPNEDKGSEDRVLVGMQNSFQLVDSKIHASVEDEKVGANNGLLGRAVVQMQQQQSQGTSVCWERFLHVRSIRVLLVENDHSTRHIVSALLRNCNYEVIDTSNGAQAWKILEDLTNHIDLVLMEVVMPCSTGIALLCKIMSHKTRKNIPVITMSSNDSMSLVVMCLSKGAVDFLVKPIRKNELKNLWQHVWRRCHSSSGSESGTQTHKYVKSKDSEESDDSDIENRENDGSNGFTVGDGSDDGSGAQSSWTKQAIEADSSQAMSLMDQVAECQDSTCAQVIHSNDETSGVKRVHMCESEKVHERKLPGTATKSKDIKATTSMNRESKSENPTEIPLVSTGQGIKSSSESNCNTNIKQVEAGHADLSNESLIEKHKCGNDKISNPSVDARESESSREVTNILNISNKAADDVKGPNLETSLKRLRGVQDTGRSAQDDRYILRRSEQSAFSRYNTSSNFQKTTDGITGSNSLIDYSAEFAKRESVGDVQALSTDLAVNQGSNGVSNNIDMGSSTNKLSTHPSTRKDKSESTSPSNYLNPSTFKHVKNDLRSTQQQDSLLLQKDMHAADLTTARGLHKESRTQHPHYHKNHHNFHHHFHHLKEQPHTNVHDITLQKFASAGPHLGSTNILVGPMDDNHSNYSLNRSDSGSNRGSNGQNGSNTDINHQGTNIESDAGQDGKSGSGDASGTGCGNGIDENKLSQREATLNKFRQKRKERCFKKKVRYQNRKRIAEQRPRIRGQFVKQAGTDCSNKGGED